MGICWGVFFTIGFPFNVACNVMTTPGSLGCTASRVYCYADGCGVVNLPRMPNLGEIFNP